MGLNASINLIFVCAHLLSTQTDGNLGTSHALTEPHPPHYSQRMHYTQLFRGLREAKGLTLEGLAELAECHRNTVINVESGRPVKFKTIADLMAKMGYTLRSDELKSLALLWLEATSGIPFSRKETETSALKTIANYRTTTRQAVQRLGSEATEANLSVEQINLLIFALRHPEALSILENIRDLMTTLNTESANDRLQLKVAEDKA